MLVLLLVIAVAQGAARWTGAQTWHVVMHPIDPHQLTGMPFGTVSPWLQPWRSTLTTRAATALQDAIGINLDVTPAEAPATARLLHDSGFRRARIELPWGDMSYGNPGEVASPAAIAPYITAMRTHRLRPLILLNANSGGPGPMNRSVVTLTAPAPAGATTVLLSGASATQIVPGLTGFDTLLPYPQRPGDLITQVGATGLATLSRPLPMALPAGPGPVTTLRYTPFAPPYLADGSPNPRFESTLTGWLAYAKGVAQFVRDVYGSSDFDIEVWNELAFGSAFLDERNYYSPVPDPGSQGDVKAVLLQRTVQMLHDPANGLTGVKVGDGFSNQTPFSSGATVPSGTDAINRHPYPSSRVFPQSPPAPGIKPLDAFGHADYSLSGSATTPQVHPTFIPRYRVLMPEYYLTGVQTETLMRDLSPITTTIYGIPHGAGTHPVGSAPPRLWITEDGLDAAQAIANGVPAADVPELQAKAALRFFVSYASEGAQAIDLYAAAGGACCQLIPPAFLNSVDVNPSSYPAGLGGLTMEVVRRMTSTLTGAESVLDPRQLTLSAIAQLGNGAQFQGSGRPAFPSLYNRNVLAFFPFQVNRHRFVSAVYVMSTDVSRKYTSHPASGLTPFDMPPEQFRLTIGNVDAEHATVSLIDPLTRQPVQARIIARSSTSIVAQLPVTDSPRMLTIEDGPASHS